MRTYWQLAVLAAILPDLLGCAPAQSIAATPPQPAKVEAGDRGRAIASEAEVVPRDAICLCDTTTPRYGRVSKQTHPQATPLRTRNFNAASNMIEMWIAHNKAPLVEPPLVSRGGWHIATRAGAQMFVRAASPEHERVAKELLRQDPELSLAAQPRYRLTVGAFLPTQTVLILDLARHKSSPPHDAPWALPTIGVEVLAKPSGWFFRGRAFVAPTDPLRRILDTPPLPERSVADEELEQPHARFSGTFDTEQAPALHSILQLLDCSAVQTIDWSAEPTDFGLTLLGWGTARELGVDDIAPPTEPGATQNSP